MRLSRVARAIVSLAFSVLTILFLYGYLAPFGLSPSLIFGPDFSNFFGTMTTTGSVASFVPSVYASFLPGGAAGLIIWTVLSRMGGVTRAGMAPSASSPDEMMRMINMPAMMGGTRGMPGMMGVPETLPADISRSQFVILRSYRQGLNKADAIAKSLSMDKKDVETETSALMSNGYLSKNSKLTTKGMDLLGN